MVATLFRAVKRHTRPLAALCLLVLAGQWLDTLWLVVPSLRPQGFRIGVPDVLATIGIGAVWLAYALRAVESAPPAPLPVPEVAPHA